MSFWPATLIGMPVYEQKSLCRTKFLRWKRPHRRPRIAKKWHRFGAVHGGCTGYAYEMAPHKVGFMQGPGCLVACPCYLAALTKALKAKK